MKKAFLSIMAILVAALGLSSCEETVELNNSQIFNPAIQGEIRTDTLYAVRDTTYSIPEPSTINSDRLLTGSFSGFTCKPVLKFQNLPQNAIFFKAFIKLYTVNQMGDNIQPFTAHAYLITQNWTSNLDSVWNEPDIIDSTKSLGTLLISEPDTSSNYSILEVDSTAGLAILKSWADQDSSQFNYGFILDFDSASFINEFYSNRRAEGPMIVFEYMVPGDTVISKDSSFATEDAYLFESSFSRVPDRDYAMTLTPRVTLLQFKTDSLLQEYPQGIIVSSANLQLSIDKTNSLIHKNFGARLHILPLTSDLDDSVVVVNSDVSGNPLYQIDVSQISDDTSFVQIKKGSERRDFGQLYLQETLENPIPEKKLYVGFKNKIDFLSYFTFLKKNTANRKDRPRLIIDFWVPPKPRF